MSQSKKVVFVLLACAYDIDSRVKQEVESLIKAGFKVHVFCWEREEESKDFVSDELVVRNMKTFTSKSFGKVKYALAAVLLNFRGFLYGVKLVKKHGKIVVHSNDFNTILGAYLLKIFFSKRVKVVYDSHELTPAVYEEWYGKFIGRIAGFLERFWIKCADVVLTVSEPIASYLKSITNKPVYIFYNYPSKKIIPKVDKLKAREILGLAKDKFIVSYVGNLRQDVAIFELLESAKLLKNDGLNGRVRIVIVGSGPRWNDVSDFVRKNNLEDTVILVPRVPRDKALLYLISTDYSYIIYKKLGYNTKIGMPWKLFESLACGSGVIIRSGTYMEKHLRKNCLDFVLVDKVKPENIKLAISNLQRGNQSNDGIKFVWESQEDQFVKIYQILEDLV